MSFTVPDHWVWDFWIADDGDRYHLFYLRAPRSLGVPALRHRNATIGHATSSDLVTWVDHGAVVGPGGPGDFDETAAWTGSVLAAPDGTWRLFYTGARFLHPDAGTNIESIGMASSADLHEWTKVPGTVLRADDRWYETLGDGTWREEACRDPWVYAAPGGDGWCMLYTARAPGPADVPDRGVIGFATSPDLETWTAQPPLSRPGAGFLHLEVPHLVRIGGESTLLFSCGSDHLATWRVERGQTGGVWAAPMSADGTFAVEAAYLLLDQQRYYCGRPVQARDGRWVLLAFNHVEDKTKFVGGVCDPLPLGRSADGRVVVLDGPGPSGTDKERTA